MSNKSQFTDPGNPDESSESVASTRALFTGRRRKDRFRRRVACVAEHVIDAISQVADPRAATLTDIVTQVKARFSGIYGALALSAITEFLPTIIRIVFRAIKLWVTDEFPWTEWLDKILGSVDALLPFVAAPRAEYHSHVHFICKHMSGIDRDAVSELSEPLVALWVATGMLVGGAEA